MSSESGPQLKRKEIVNAFRWDLDDAMDGQPDYLKFVVKHIFDTFQEFEREVASELGGSYSLKATIDAVIIQ